jgi:predicted dehydrogenase
VWDEDAARGQTWAQALGVEFIADCTALLAREDIDAVVVTSPTDRHKDLIIGAARAGKHVFTEKVLATNLADARAIAEVVGESAIRFTISFPRRTLAPLLYARQQIASGAIGDVTLLRIRIAHDGALRNWLPDHFYDAAACGGGAMIDLGAHGMYLSCWLLGRPRRVTSLFTSHTGRAVEDNAVSVIEFESNAIAINETAFVSWGGAFTVEIDGTRGGFLMASPRDVRIRGGEDKTWRASDSLPPPAALPVPRWLDSILAGRDPDDGMGIDAALQLSRMMDAAYRSHTARRTVAFDELED